MFRQLILRTGVVTSNRVGNLLGACSANGARNAAHASALTSVVIGSLIMIAMLAVRDVSLLECSVGN